MSLALAAVGAALAALIQSTTVPFVAGGAAELDLVLVLAITWTMTAGLEGVSSAPSSEASSSTSC